MSGRAQIARTTSVALSHRGRCDSGGPTDPAIELDEQRKRSARLLLLDERSRLRPRLMARSHMRVGRGGAVGLIPSTQDASLPPSTTATRSRRRSTQSPFADAGALAATQSALPAIRATTHVEGKANGSSRRARRGAGCWFGDDHGASGADIEDSPIARGRRRRARRPLTALACPEGVQVGEGIRWATLRAIKRRSNPGAGLRPPCRGCGCRHGPARRARVSSRAAGLRLSTQTTASRQQALSASVAEAKFFNEAGGARRFRRPR